MTLRTLVPPSAPGRLAALDGLRGIAVIAVVAFHYLPGIVPGGYLGVDVFFVLSGFLITTGLVRERAAGGIRLGSFWVHRARRLLPALALMVLATGTAALAIGGDATVRFGVQVAAAAGFFSNWYLVGGGNGYFEQSAPPLYQNLWSLAIEEQFYLVWPFIVIALALIPSRRVRVAIVAGAAVASAALLAWFALTADAGRAYYGSDSHCFGLLAGAALAVALQDAHDRPTRRRWDALAVAALAGIIAAAILFSGDTAGYLVGLPLATVLTVALILAVLRSHGIARAVLSWRPLAAVGERSYGIYLWHWPVLLLVQSAGPADGWAALLALALTAAAAWLSFAYIERPVLRLGLRTALRRAFDGGPGRRKPALGIAATALVVALAATALACVSAPQRTAAEQQVLDGLAAIADESDADASPAPQAAPAAPTPAEKPSPNARGKPAASVAKPITGRQITAIGDSVMLASARQLIKTMPGIRIDAVVSRQAWEAPRLIRSLKKQGKLRDVVLIGLGTNGYLGDGTLKAIRRDVGPDRELIFVNVYAARVWQDKNNRQLAAFTAHDSRAELVDWHSAIAKHTSLLGPDRIHPGEAGGRLYAQCVVKVLKRITAG